MNMVRETVETNVYGPLLLCQALVPLMERNGHGRIVNVSSGMGQLSDMGSGNPAYRLSKTALNAVTAMVSAQVRGRNILVNSMCPGWVRTDMGGSAAPRSVEQGADTALWLGTLPDEGPTGGFFRDRKPVSW
jgi:NAD(P)-dependent dehydrogenase (short-subunit alcohol dehydrogenase family)